MLKAQVQKLEFKTHELESEKVTETIQLAKIKDAEKQNQQI